MANSIVGRQVTSDPQAKAVTAEGKGVVKSLDKLLLRPDEAREILSIGRTKFYQMLSSGEIPSIYVGRSVRVPLASLKAWVEAHAKKTEIDHHE